MTYLHLTPKRKKTKLTDTDNILVVARGEGWGLNKTKGIKMYKLSAIKYAMGMSCTACDCS